MTSMAMSDENKLQETSSIKTKVYKFQENWKTNRLWLMFDNELNVMYTATYANSMINHRKPTVFRKAHRASESKMLRHTSTQICTEEQLKVSRGEF